MPTSEKHAIHFGDFELDTECGQLRKNGFGVKLQGQPVQILEILLGKPGELVTREELRQRLWSTDTFVDFDHSLNTAIKRLRQALGDDAETPHYIETIPKRGYRFVGETKIEALAEPETTAPAPTNFDDARNASQPRFRHRILSALALCVAFSAVCATAYFMLIPVPQPHIVAAHQLTKTGFRKEGRLLTDGRSIYFKEFRSTGPVVMQVSVKGGEVVNIPVLPSRMNDLFLGDISKDGSEILLMMQASDEGRSDVWSQPLPTGSARLLVKNAAAPRWTPDARSFFFLRREGRDIALYRANADGGNIQRLLAMLSIMGLAISPDGARIRFGIGNTVWEANADGSNPQAVIREHGGWAGNWSPDGRYYFYRSWREQDLWAAPDRLRSYRRRPQPAKLTFGPFWVGVPSMSADGKHIYAIATERRGELSIYDSRSREFAPYLGGISACYVDFSRDGQWITYVSYPEGDLLRSKADGSERRQLTWPPYAVINPRWSPDGKLIAFSEISGGNRDHLGETSRIYVVSADGGQPMLLVAGSRDDEAGDPTWSPDGRRIAYSIGGPLQFVLKGIKIIDLETQSSVQVPGSEELWSPRWSPDGKYLIALQGPGATKVMLFSFNTQEWKELIKGNGFGWPAWTADSKHIVVYDGARLLRVNIFDGQKEQIADVRSFRSTGYYWWDDNGYSLTPDGTPIATRDTSSEEIYDFDLEYK